MLLIDEIWYLSVHHFLEYPEWIMVEEGSIFRHLFLPEYGFMGLYVGRLEFECHLVALSCLIG